MRMSVSAGISNLYVGLTSPFALKKFLGAAAGLNSTHGLKGALDRASATVPSKTPALGPRRIMMLASGWLADSVTVWNLPSL